MTTSKPPTIRFKFLDGLRGLAALYVVITHFFVSDQFHGGSLVGWQRLLNSGLGFTLVGVLSVDIFIVLSGFSLMLPVTRSVDKHLRVGLLQYFKRRARRILPPYYAALDIALLMPMLVWGLKFLMGLPVGKEWLPQYNFGDLISHIFLFHNLTQWNGTLDPPMWSVATEWQIYFVFPALLLPLRRKFGNAVVLIIVCGIGLLPHFFLPEGHNFDPAYPWYVGLFTMGMVSADVVSSTDLRKSKWTRYLLPSTVLFIFFYFAFKFMERHTNPGLGELLAITKFFWGGAAASSLIIYCYLVVNHNKIGPGAKIVRLLEAPWAVTLGHFSYSIYLFHWFVLLFADVITDAYHFGYISVLLFRAVVAIPVTLIVSYLFYLAFKQPFTKNPQVLVQHSLGKPH